jgi:hypothetical protein
MKTEKTLVDETEREVMAYRILSALSDVEKYLKNEGYVPR